MFSYVGQHIMYDKDEQCKSSSNVYTLIEKVASMSDILLSRIYFLKKVKYAS